MTSKLTGVTITMVLVAVVLLAVAGPRSARAAGFDAGLPADGSSSAPSISADGRYVAFTSNANNLSDKDNNRYPNVFVRDLVTNTTTLVSRQGAADGGGSGNSGSYTPAISGNGRYVAFESRSSTFFRRGERHADVINVFVRDLRARTTRLLSSPVPVPQPLGSALKPVISGDGSVVAFVLSRGDIGDRIVIRETRHARSEVITPPRDPKMLSGLGPGVFALALAANGRALAFVSGDALFLRNLRTGRTVRGPTACLGEQDQSLSLSAGGRFLTCGGGYLYDAQKRTSREIDCQGPISGDGRFLACLGRTGSPEHPLGGLVLRSRSTGSTRCLVCKPSGIWGGSEPDQFSISQNGRYLAFRVKNTNLGTVADSRLSNIFVHDADTGQTTLVSRQTGSGA